MQSRYLVIWFPHLLTDRFAIRQPELRSVPFVLIAPVRGRMVIQAACPRAERQGVFTGMVAADARAICPELRVLHHKPEVGEKLLKALALWCIRYTPVASVDQPDGLVLDISGCTHLWGGERAYLEDLLSKLSAGGYNTRAAIADTIGAAWAACRYGACSMIIEPGRQMETLLSLPPAALRLEQPTLQRMHKLGMHEIRSFIQMSRSVLRRRFGDLLLTRLNQALGAEKEIISPVCPPQPFEERLPCLDPIRTAAGIEIALQKLLQGLCSRLEKESKGLRSCMLRYYRIDGKILQLGIGTSRASRNPEHLFKLLKLKIPEIEPDLGIELFVLEAPIVEPLSAEQEALWNMGSSSNNVAVAQLLDKLMMKLGGSVIRRYLPAEHYWPERSIQPATSLQDKPTTNWRSDLPRPIHLLRQPAPIQVTVPIPDYPPMNFIYEGTLHKVRKADGPERIEREWWIDTSLHRDYYCVEDEDGLRYWLFRLGHYDEGEPKWFIHGFFA